MSVSCERSYQLIVPPALVIPSAYWEYEEVGSVTRFDKINNLQQVVFTGSVPSGTGIIGNAAHFAINNIQNELFLNFPSGLNFVSGGFTFTFWLNVTTYGAAFLSINLGFGGSSDIVLRYTGPSLDFVVQPDNNPDIHTALGNQPTGWQFFTVVYDASIPAVKVTINRGAVTQINLLAPFDPFTNAGFTVDSVDGKSDFLFDEAGVWMNLVLPDSSLDQLYNHGAGMRPPFS